MPFVFSILFSRIKAKPIQNIGFTNSTGIKVIIIKSIHLDEPFLSKPKPGIIVKIKIAKKSRNINGDHLFNVFNSKRERARKTITQNNK